MSTSAISTNLLILANAAEMARLTIVSMMSEQCVANLFGQPAARESVYRALNVAVQRRLSNKIQSLPTGQFMKSVQTNSTTNRGQTNPNA